MRRNHLLAPLILCLMCVEAAPSTPARAEVLTESQVLQVLDESVSWYHAVGAQPQSPAQPSDSVALNANQPVADKVIKLAFDFARSGAEWLTGQEPVDARSSPQAIEEARKRLDEMGASIQAQIARERKQHGRSTAATEEQAARLIEMQGELAIVKARKNLLDTVAMGSFLVSPRGASATALKGRIEAMAVSVPSLSSAAPAASATTAATPTSPGTSTDVAADHVGIWDLSANALRLYRKVEDISARDAHTAALEETFLKVRAPLIDHLKELSAQSDALADRSEHTVTLSGLRDQFDTLAWLVTLTSQTLRPLSTAQLLLEQYRHNLSVWRETVRRQYYGALVALGVRFGILVAMLAALFAGSRLWRRLVLRYVGDTRRRYRLLWIRGVTTWVLAIAILSLTPATALSSFATFAGLIAAGVAVAMQSVLLSIVGYFYLTGKHGIRVGERVQIGTLIGQVIELGLVRTHLLELNSQEPWRATGRVVTFANSVVFQASGGVIKQIEGVNFAWHESSVTLPPGSVSEALKHQLLNAVNDVLGGYQAEIFRQTEQITKASGSASIEDARPYVLLHVTAAGVEARVRYPVPLPQALEIDERVSEALLRVARSAES